MPVRRYESEKEKQRERERERERERKRERQRESQRERKTNRKINNKSVRESREEESGRDQLFGRNQTNSSPNKHVHTDRWTNLQSSFLHFIQSIFRL